MMRSRQRGFALLTIVLILAVLALAGTVVINAMTLEQRLLGLTRLSTDARASADGALFEVINDRDLTNYLPDYSSAGLRATYAPSANSAYNHGETVDGPARSYTATIELVRSAPVYESSTTNLRALVYDIEVQTEIGTNLASEQARGQVFRIFSPKEGTVLPDLHAR